jgi:hypothetical protein
MAPATVVAQSIPAVKPTVAVLPVTFFSVKPGVDAAAGRDAVTAMLIGEFSDLSAVEIVERQRVADLIAREIAGGTGRLSDQDAQRFGQMLGAQFMVISAMTIEPRAARFDLRLINVETGGSVRQPMRKNGNPDELSKLVEETVKEFTKDLVWPRAAAANAAIPAAASLTFSRGLDYEKRGKKDLAAKMYQKTLEIFPAHPQAKAALDRVR